MAGPGRDDDHDEEVRFALVLNGRVSLAIWMGGVTPEIDRLTRTRPGADSGYERVLDLVQARARADVIAGTSAGGINGGFLALGQAYEYAELSGMRDLWAFKGNFTALLRSPKGSDCRRCCVVTATSRPSCARPSREWCTRLGAAQPIAASGRSICSSTTIPVGQRRRFSDVLEQPIWEVEHQPVHLLAEPFRTLPPGYR